MGDLICRQAAIDALKEHRALYCDNTPDAFSKLSHAEKSRVDELNTAIATLVNLPPIQPEIIRCRNCKFASGDSRICMKFDHSPIGELDFCSFAERREVTT